MDILKSSESLLRGIRFRLSRHLVDCNPVEVWPGIESVAIELAPYKSQFGNVDIIELIVLCSIVKHTEAKSIFEFGTFDGLTSWHLAANGGPNCRVLTVDLPLDHPARAKPGPNRKVGKIYGIQVGSHYTGTPEGERIEQLYVDSMQFDPEPYRGCMDFCFIDAGHGYETVLRDTENALAMVRPGGSDPLARLFALVARRSALPG